MGRLAVTAIAVFVLAALLIAGVLPAEARSPQELETDVTSLHAALQAQQAKVTQLQTALQAHESRFASQQALMNQRIANESAMAKMLIQWHKALEAMRGSHFIYTPHYENNVFSYR